MWLIHIEDISAGRKTNEHILQQCRKNHLLLPEHQGEQAEIFQGHTKESGDRSAKTIARDRTASKNGSTDWVSNVTEGKFPQAMRGCQVL